MSEKFNRYFTRTVEHIHRVQNNMVTLVTKFRDELKLSDEDCRLLVFNVMKHDQSKFSQIQFMPYIELTEYYHQRKALGNKGYEYPSPIIKDAVDVAVLDHYKQENHHMEKGDRKGFHEIVEVACDLQAMAQEFNEGSFRGYYTNVWKPKYMKEIVDDHEWFFIVQTMEQVLECFEKSQ